MHSDIIIPAAFSLLNGLAIVSAFTYLGRSSAKERQHLVNHLMAKNSGEFVTLQKATNQPSKSDGEVKPKYQQML